MSPRLRIIVSASVALAAFAGVARADDVYRFAANGVPQVEPLLRDVQVRRIDNGKLFFRDRNGVERSVELASVFYLKISADPTLSAADFAFAQRDYDKAVDEFQRAMRSADGWKMRWIAPRLLVAADKANRFDAALAAFVATARVDPAAAASAKPALPERPSKYLDEASQTLDAAAKDATSDAERQVLLAWLVDVERARDDRPAIDAAIDRLAKSATAAAPKPAAATDVPRPTEAAPTPRLPPAEAAAAAAVAIAVGADARLTQARAALAAGKYDEVAAAIDAAAPMLVRSDQQAEALALVARARSAAADVSGEAGARRDAAIAWMRLVAHFNADPAAAPLVAEGMLDAARQQSDAGDVAAARALYEQLLAERPDAPAAKVASQRLEKLDGR